MRDAHIESTITRLDRELAQKPADLVVLPELSGLDYSREAFDVLDELSEEATGVSFQHYRELAMRHDVTVVFGIARKTNHQPRISQVAVSPKGILLGYFDKLHRAHFGASMEKDYFEAGEHLFVFDCCGVRVAPIICYDIRFPELLRQLAIENEVDLILHCGAYARDESFDSWHAFVKTRAMENQIYLLSLNRAGEQFGHSLFCEPWVDQKHPAIEFSEHDEHFRHFTIDTQRIATVRQQFQFIHDRLSNYEQLPVRGN